VALLGTVPRPVPDAYLVHQGEGTLAAAFALGEQLRAAGFSVVLHAGGGGFKSQMRKADASGARVALILGEDELRDGAVTLKPLRDARPQLQLERAALAARLPEFTKGS